MSPLLIISILAGVALTGLLRIAGRRWALWRMKRFADTYLSRFRQLAEAYDDNRYDWLLHRSTRMQEQLGPLGMTTSATTLYDYDNPWSAPATPMLSTTLPEMRARTAHATAIATCEDAIVRHLGVLDAALRPRRSD